MLIQFFSLLLHLTFGDFCLRACNLCEFWPVKFVFGPRTKRESVRWRKNSRVSRSNYQQVYMKRQQTLGGETLSHKFACRLPHTQVGQVPTRLFGRPYFPLSLWHNQLNVCLQLSCSACCLFVSLFVAALVAAFVFAPWTTHTSGGEVRHSSNSYSLVAPLCHCPEIVILARKR